MSSGFQKPALWVRAFESAGPSETDKAARLETSFIIFRERTAAVLERIANSLPNLTVHDITHIDALWDIANLIIGPSYPLNPMEAFVLGGAMLLHDAALCFEAYENGLEGVRKTVHWRDAFAAEKEKNNERDNPQQSSAIEAAADFSAVRLLHADQAPKLLDQAWTDPDTLDQIFLIDDTELRKRFGLIIGQIAASHNWSIEDVESRLPSQINAPGDWPANWRVDPVKIACILRCADAAHIDNRRAPDFLYALTRREGMSLQHWKAQNWLGRADLDQSDSSLTTILFTSNREFRADDAEAWWIYKLSPTQDLRVPFADFVSRLVTGLDVPVDVNVNNGDPRFCSAPLRAAPRPGRRINYPRSSAASCSATDASACAAPWLQSA